MFAQRNCTFAVLKNQGKVHDQSAPTLKFFCFNFLVLFLHTPKVYKSANLMREQLFVFGPHGFARDYKMRRFQLEREESYDFELYEDIIDLKKLPLPNFLLFELVAYRIFSRRVMLKLDFKPLLKSLSNKISASDLARGFDLILLWMGQRKFLTNEFELNFFDLNGEGWGKLALRAPEIRTKIESPNAYSFSYIGLYLYELRRTYHFEFNVDVVLGVDPRLDEFFDEIIRLGGLFFERFDRDVDFSNLTANYTNDAYSRFDRLIYEKLELFCINEQEFYKLSYFLRQRKSDLFPTFSRRDAPLFECEEDPQFVRDKFA